MLGSDSIHLGADEADKDKYLFNSLMEEAIASSQLEGAVTTRRVAKQMLREGRKPRSMAERMIFNNYQAILRIRDRQKDDLSPQLLRELHSVLTSGTFDDPSNEGRFRQPDDNVVVEDSYSHDVLHNPPPAESIDGRIKEIGGFANRKSRPFVHPVTKAIILHFAIGYLHPFVNTATAALREPCSTGTCLSTAIGCLSSCQFPGCFLCAFLSTPGHFCMPRPIGETLRTSFITISA